MRLHRHTPMLHLPTILMLPRPRLLNLMRRHPPSLRVTMHRRLATTATIRLRTASTVSIRRRKATDDGTQLPFRAFVWGAVETEQPPGSLELPP
jgi:hypothetical protein